ncbi:MAG: Membrane-bound lytic murein transglycosylase B precursor (EC [uncultured Sulfurovum sp.]|uniref:Membrane-bound lytic murein transglycosylase B (EC) n=1 Tax=uncultured Sulfurovum sp. TaxID=269237 RepID=A0A6S6T7C1_9BACT|nr:MAG: Membrane-bound lytic murein transglycosylase B precursor (EC [uncultured Sulfurovum sp.]
MCKIPLKGVILRMLRLFLLLVFLSPLSLFALDYTKKAEVRQFIDMMNKKYNYNRSYLNKIFKQVRKDPIAPHKKSKPKIVKPLSEEYRPQGEWDIYSRVHLENNQSKLGVQFMHKHRKTFERAYEEYGVPPEYITAIIGIESYYGKNRGRYYVFDSLSHLAFNSGKRKKFYKYQLQEFLRMCYREQVEPRAIKGSKSGAIGLAQFMPSNYKPLAVDFDNDGKIRISKPTDAIGSIANYFKESGWKKDEPVGTRVSYEGNRFYGLKTGYKHKYHRKNLLNIRPREHFNYTKKVMLIKLEKEKYDELWYGANNFYVITRYNHSSYYAMAIHQLAQQIKKEYQVKYNKRQT